ncbi:sensor histidine kinase [Catenuloplanes japonicus]|uniref:sensor histidine kinase n=1 Tax=Catenuloplanes japonicus TaxID=33876 RepID=UPI0006917AE1|nr:histidine kinase [Catenuloplanes japonicus]
MNPIAWWHARSQAERFDVSFRSSFYVSLLAVPMLIGTSVGVDRGSQAALIATVLAVADMALIMLLMHHGIEHYLGRRERPTVLLLTAGAVTVLGSAAGIAAFPLPDPGHTDSPASLILTALSCTYMVGLAGLHSLWPAMVVAGAGTAASTALAFAQGAETPLGPATALLFLLLVLFGTYRSSLWMLSVVWELDRARTVQANLAVTEERLRFARDMHDVLGRNLSVIALKAELAAQLAKRGREQAVEEMLEVRRIAQDALADVRAVVAGYRSAELGDELAGARSLLASAGIECRVIGDPVDLPPEVQGTLGWVVREGVTNVLRHSDARSCTITLRSDAPGTVTLSMENDGARVPGTIRYGGGLLGLTERVATLHGGLTAGPVPPSGFLLTVTIPLPAAGSTPPAATVSLPPA